MNENETPNHTVLPEIGRTMSVRKLLRCRLGSCSE